MKNGDGAAGSFQRWLTLAGVDRTRNSPEMIAKHEATKAAFKDVNWEEWFEKIEKIEQKKMNLL